MNSYSTIQPLHISLPRCTAESITPNRNAYHFNVSHIGRRAIHNRYLPCQDIVHHSVWVVRAVHSFSVSQKKKKSSHACWMLLLYPWGFWGGINANEMAERETLALWLMCRWMNKPSGDDTFCLKALIGFLQTSCEAKSPSTPYIESSNTRERWAPLDFAGTRLFATDIVRKGISFIISLCTDRIR